MNNPTSNRQNDDAPLRLRIIQINDVYVLDNLANFASLAKRYATRSSGRSSDFFSGLLPFPFEESNRIPIADETLVVVSGDFLGKSNEKLLAATAIASQQSDYSHLVKFIIFTFRIICNKAPSLLSSLDKGHAMVDVLNRIGITHACFGNHEADVPLSELRRRIRESNFVWVSTNMRLFNQTSCDLEGVCTPTHDIVRVVGRATMPADNDGFDELSQLSRQPHVRHIALLGLLTNDPSLYKPGAFGGATIEPIIETTKSILHTFSLTYRRNEDVDRVKSGGVSIELIVPMTHQSIMQDRKFVSIFGGDTFPIVIGGHDHDLYDEAHNGSRIIKTGMDAHRAAIIDIVWEDSLITTKPRIRVDIVDTKAFPPDTIIDERVHEHQRILSEIKTSMLFRIPFVPSLSSQYSSKNNAHQEAFSTYCNRIQPTAGSTLLVTAMRCGMRSEVAIFNAGGIRGNQLYTGKTWFTWSNLIEEIPFPAPLVSVYMPGKVLQHAIAYSRRGSYKQPKLASGGYLHTCDMIEYDDDSQRIQRIRGQPFDADRKYLTTLPVSHLKGIDKNMPLMDWASTELPHLLDDVGRAAKTAIVEYFTAKVWIELASFADIDQGKDRTICLNEVRNRAIKVLGEGVSDLVVQNVFAIADLNNDGAIHPLEMLVTVFIAMDMSELLSHRDENTILIARLAISVLGFSISSEIVTTAADELAAIFRHRDANITNYGATKALGGLKGERLLS